MSTVHPAKTTAFDILVSELDARVASGMISTPKRDGNLVQYTYSQRCTYDNGWDLYTEMARGLVLDLGRKMVVATPFPKFFGYGERGKFNLPDDETFEAFEKVDGSLGIVFHDGNTWRVVTKGSFTAPQGQWATEWASAHGLFEEGMLTKGNTYLFEIVYSQNRIVVKYPFEGMVLLGAYHESGVEFEREELEAIATTLGCRVARRFQYTSVTDMLEACKTMTNQQEGFVVRFQGGYRIKIKGDAYKRVHSILSNVTPLGIWRAMDQGDDLSGIRREIPEEFWEDFDSIQKILEGKLQEIVETVEQCSLEFEGKTDKEVGLARNSITDPWARQFIFPRRKGGKDWWKKPGSPLFKAIRPTSNELPEYQPSTYLLGAQDKG